MTGIENEQRNMILILISSMKTIKQNKVLEGESPEGSCSLCRMDWEDLFEREKVE